MTILCPPLLANDLNKRIPLPHVTRNKVWAATGYAGAIQTAINTAAPYGEVYIPSAIGVTSDGKWHWNGEQVTQPAGVDLFGSSYAGCLGHEMGWRSLIAKTVIHNDAVPPINHPMILLQGQIGGDMSLRKSRIAGIQFEATAPPDTSAENAEDATAITTNQTVNTRIDHCTFINFCGTSVSLACQDGRSGGYYGSGLIDHCTIDNLYKLQGSGWAWAYGFYSVGNTKPEYTNWDSDITHFLGRFDTVPNAAGCQVMFIEDCHLSRCRHATDGLQGAWNVIRYNLIDTEYPAWGEIDLHGSQSWYSGRGMEVYRNYIRGVQSSGSGNNASVRLRGGCGIIFGNTYYQSPQDLTSYQVQLDNYDYSTSFPFTNINNTYIWGNTYIGSSALSALQGTQNINYFLREPTLAQDGFAYIPFKYPHPRTGES